jgi:hypothetical protein
LIDDLEGASRIRHLQKLDSGATRTRFTICLAISSLVHAGILAWSRVGIPEIPAVEEIAMRSISVTDNESSAKRLIQVIQIQPLTLVRSSGSKGGRLGGTNRGGGPTVPPLTSAPTLPAIGLELAFLKEAPLALPSLQDFTLVNRDENRPNRGIVLHTGGIAGSTTSFNGQGNTGRFGTGWGGRGGSSIGRGRGGDCISIGLINPAGRISGLRGQGASFPTGRIGRFGGNHGFRP